MTASRALVGLLLASVPSVFSAPDAEQRQTLARLSKLPRRNFVNGMMQVERELQSIQLKQEEEESEDDLNFFEAVRICLDAAGALRDPIANVADTCDMAIQDFLNLENIEDLVGLCGNENIDACSQALQDLVAEAEPQFETCVNALNEALDAEFEVPDALDDIADALDASLLQQAVCMAGDIAEDAIECSGELQDFIDTSGTDAIACFSEFVNQEEECSAECTDLANTFVDAVGCCATGLIYSLNIDGLLMNFMNTSDDAVAIEELTACGVQLFGCNELETLFADNQLTMLALPAPLQAEESEEGKGEGDSEEGDSEEGDSDEGDSEEGDSEEGDSEEGDSEEGEGEEGDSEEGDSEEGEGEGGDDEEGDDAEGEGDDIVNEQAGSESESSSAAATSIVTSSLVVLTLCVGAAAL